MYARRLNLINAISDMYCEWYACMWCVNFGNMAYVFPYNARRLYILRINQVVVILKIYNYRNYIHLEYR